MDAASVDVKPHVELLRISDFVFRHQPGPERTKGVATFALIPLSRLHLERPLRVVVGQAVACNDIDDCVFETFFAIEPVTIATSTSQSGFEEPCSPTVLLFGPHRVVTGFTNGKIGLMHSEVCCFPSAELRKDQG